MKKSYKNKLIYDAMILRLAVCLEHYVNETLNLEEEERKNISYNDKIKSFKKLLQDKKIIEKDRKDIRKCMEEIFDKRHKIAHPNGKDNSRPCYNHKDFFEIRRECVNLDKQLKEHELKKTQMSKMMFHNLPYDMGNAGDIIKHGMLAEFVKWWLNDEENNNKTLRMADPFGGCPWEKVENPKIIERLRKLKYFAISNILDEENYYHNGSHLVKRISKNRTSVWTSDKDPIASSDIEASDLTFIEKDFSDYDNEDGYSILCPEKYANEFDLIFLDPFEDFLPRKIYEKIIPMINKNPNLFVMAFVLDRIPKDNPTVGEEKTHKTWEEFKNENKKCIFSIKCGKIENSGIKGEENYTMEAVLFFDSDSLSDKGGELRESLQKFAKAATDALNLEDQEVEFCP